MVMGRTRAIACTLWWPSAAPRHAQTTGVSRIPQHAETTVVSLIPLPPSASFSTHLLQPIQVAGIRYATMSITHVHNPCPHFPTPHTQYHQPCQRVGHMVRCRARGSEGWDKWIDGYARARRIDRYATALLIYAYATARHTPRHRVPDTARMLCCAHCHLAHTYYWHLDM